jgi:hypothetical protein
MECREKQRLTEQYFDALKRQQCISEGLQVVRSGGDMSLTSILETQQEAAIEATYEAWRALNKHECSRGCDHG